MIQFALRTLTTWQLSEAITWPISGSWAVPAVATARRDPAGCSARGELPGDPGNPVLGKVARRLQISDG